MRNAVAGLVILAAATASGGIEHTILHGVSVADVSWERGGSVVAPAAMCAQPTQELARSAVADFVEH